jgi:cation diffusion facilitator CzcD-associated flavoprotein CzcO
MYQQRVVIVGAGPSGVATAVSLRDRGIAPILIDRADRVASSWAARSPSRRFAFSEQALVATALRAAAGRSAFRA